jgi:hypothetical protein
MEAGAKAQADRSSITGMKSTTTTEATMPKQFKTTQSAQPNLLERVEAHYRKYVGFANPDHAKVLTLWTLHTYAFDASYNTPYIYVSSVDPGAGKSTLIDTARDIVHAPRKTDSLTAAVLFRVVDAGRGAPDSDDTAEQIIPTMFIDEVDTIYSGSKNDDLRGILNSGYERDGVASRVVNGEPMDFHTYAPKLMAGIDNGELPPTVLDRSIRIRLRKLGEDALREQNVTRRNARKIARDESIPELRADLAEWASFKTVDALADIEPDTLPGLSARQWDICEPLMQIAISFGVEKEMGKALVSVITGEKVETEEVRILRTAQEIFAAEGEDTDRITTASLAGMVGYTPDRLSRKLSPLGVPAKPIKFGGEVKRGYYRTDFEQAWKRYL